MSDFEFDEQDIDAQFMQEALALAKLGWGKTNPNPMVGAVIVRDRRILGRGFHMRAGEPHAEINALHDAERLDNPVKGATLYVTLEPCSTYGRTPPCTEAIIKSGIKRVVVGSVDPNPNHAGRGLEILREAGIDVEVGVENADCNEINLSFFKWIRTGKPFVMLKMAMTLDGKIATYTGDSRWVTGPEARSRVQQLRRLADAILIGSHTLRHDHPRLTVREPEEWQPQPLRIVASEHLDHDDLLEYFPEGNAEVVDLSEPENWEPFLLDLGQRRMTALLIEGGGELAASSLQAHAVDYVEFHIAPRLLGGRDSLPVLGGESPEFMNLAQQLHRVKVERYGDDIAISGFTRE